MTEGSQPIRLCSYKFFTAIPILKGKKVKQTTQSKHCPKPNNLWQHSGKIQRKCNFPKLCSLSNASSCCGKVKISALGTQRRQGQVDLCEFRATQRNSVSKPKPNKRSLPRGAIAHIPAHAVAVEERPAGTGTRVQFGPQSPGRTSVCPHIFGAHI